MKYNVFTRTWKDGSGYYVISPMTFEAWDKATGEDATMDRKYAQALVSFSKINQAEAKQHAQKLAAYFEEVDTAKEAVIRCTKL